MAARRTLAAASIAAASMAAASAAAASVAPASMAAASTEAPNLPSDLTWTKKFNAIELKTPMAVTISTDNMDRIIRALEESAGQKTLKVHLDLSSILGQLGPHKVLRYNPETQQLDLVCMLTEEDTYPEAAAFSRSSAVIVWRDRPATATEDDSNAEGQDGDREVLLVTELKENRTAFVAGGQKPGESSLQGAAREVREEVGLDLDLATAEWIRTDEMGGAHGELNTLNTFAIKVRDPDQQIQIQQAEILAAGWYSIPEALERASLKRAKRALRAFRDSCGVPVEPRPDQRQVGWQAPGSLEEPQEAAAAQPAAQPDAQAVAQPDAQPDAQPAAQSAEQATAGGS